MDYWADLWGGGGQSGRGANKHSYLDVAGPLSAFRGVAGPGAWNDADMLLVPPPPLRTSRQPDCYNVPSECWELLNYNNRMFRDFLSVIDWYCLFWNY